MKKRVILSTVVALLASVGIAFGGGAFNGFPIVGDPGNDVCLSFGNNGVCNQFSPPGPTGVTGNELMPADTGLPNGQNPQTVRIPVSILGNSTNRLIGGDMTTNLAQRFNTTKGIAALAGLSPTAAVITADRWWVIAPAAGVTATIDSGTTAVIPGFNNTKALRIARTSSGAAGVVCVGQTLDKAASVPLIGNNAVFSFYEFNGSTQSASVAGAITVNIDYTSAADTAGTQATLGFAGGNGSKFALGDVAQSGTPTNYTNAVTGFSDGTTGTITSGVATIKASTTWTRYSVYASIPINVPATTTPVTAVSVSICWTPTATTAVTTDFIEINGMQLEAKPAATSISPNGVISQVNINFPSGVTSPSAFDKRLAAVEATYQYYYWYFNYENQAAITTIAPCVNVSVTVTNCSIAFPEVMRITPAMSYTTGFQAFTTTGYSAVGACTTLSASTSYVTAPSNFGVLVNCTATTIPAAGTGNFLTSLGTSSATGIISASAEP